MGETSHPGSECGVGKAEWHTGGSISSGLASSLPAETYPVFGQRCSQRSAHLSFAAFGGKIMILFCSQEN